ncbi:MAG: hypothetical protein Q9226_000811 [Calogaya cf. arnoldii]
MAIPSDNAEMLFYRNAISTPQVEFCKKALSACFGIVEAHSQYLKSMYFAPFSISLDPVEEGIQQLSDLLAVGDLYDSMKPLWESLNNLHVNLVVRDALNRGKHHPELLQFALKFKINWLFKEIVCRVCVDRCESDEQVISHFPAELASLILRKREILRNKMIEIDLKLLTMEIPHGNAIAHYLAVLQIREKIIGGTLLRQQTTWDNYASEYPHIIPRLAQHSPLIIKSALTPNEENDICILLEDVKRKVSDILRPLYPNGVSAGWYGMGHPCFPGVDHRCIEVSDEELPWIAAQAKGDDDHHHAAS